jgi:hypothetical protein
MSDLNNWSNVANVVMALAAIAALLYAFMEVRSSRQDTREATAIQTWMEYYLHSLEHPRYACPELLKLDYNKLDEHDEEFNNYQLFVSFMLLACDQVIRLPEDKDGPNWEQFVKNNVGYHKAYLERTESYRRFSPKLVSKIKEVLETDSEGASWL